MTKRRPVATDTKLKAINVHVGKRLRVARNLAGISQQELGKRIGLTFQQIQKYENGTNRIAADTLLLLAKTLNVSLTWFFESSPEYDEAADNTGISKRETLELLRIYHRIPNKKQRRSFRNFLKSLAKAN